MAETSVPSLPLAAAPRITWVHPPGGFFGLSLLNGLLRILTLGVYHFWGKTEVRQRMWSAVRIDNEPLEYRGTGGELFRGFLVVFALILLPLGFISFIVPLFFGGLGAGRGMFEMAFWGILFLLSGIGIHRARRYRLSRTCWRGIRAGLSGKSAPFAWTYVWTIALVPITLGWILPWRAVKLQKALFDQTYFGDKAFTFSGRAGPLYRRFWLVWMSAILLLIVAGGLVGAIVATGAGPPGATPMPFPQRLSGVKITGIAAVVLGAFFIFALIRAWYSSRMLNYFAEQTRFEGTAFQLRATVPSLVWLTASNLLIRILSLGLLSPIAEARALRYIVERLSLERSVNWSSITQNPDALLTRGEGLAEAFNVDAF